MKGIPAHAVVVNQTIGATSVIILVKLKIVEAIRPLAVRKLTEEYVGAVKMVNGVHHVSLIVRRTVLMNNVSLVMVIVYRVLMALGVALVMKHAMVINVNLAIGRRDNARNAKPGFGALDAIKHARQSTAEITTVRKILVHAAFVNQTIEATYVMDRVLSKTVQDVHVQRQLAVLVKNVRLVNGDHIVKIIVPRTALVKRAN